MYQKKILLVSLVLIVSWLLLVLELIVQRSAWQVDVFVVIAMVLTIANLRLYYLLIPEKKLRDIEALVKHIEGRNANSLEPLPIENTSIEIQPLVNAFNQLLHSAEDRTKYDYLFSSEASHELRTPLTGIRLQAQIAQRSKNPQQQQKALDNILKAVDRNTHLVNQLLTLSHLRQDTRPSVLNPLLLQILCQQVTDGYQQQARQQNITLSVVFSDNMAPVLACNELLKTLLENLLDNALHYTPVGGSIEIHCVPANRQQVSLTVSDSGPGIAVDDYDIVQIPFQKSLDGKKHGSGLGLAIVKCIAEQHGSQLLLDRAHQGGLAVSLQLTYAHVPSTDPQA
ncbi:MAG: signal transduction histidine kinase [Gammaproteobacteria bacterium]|jgi:signal transduction histidine kinase